MLIMCLPPTITFALLYQFLQNTTMIIYTNTVLTRSLIILSNQCELCEKKHFESLLDLEDHSK